MTESSKHETTFEELQARLRALLPETYDGIEDEVLPVSMGSAGLKYGADGSVAWDEIWGSFCDLAMAGGPPHRGKLLEPGDAASIAAEAGRYSEVVAEICRGIRMVTGLHAERSPTLGWVRVYCTSAPMAGWMMRAIVMENVSAGGKGLVLELPAGPAFRMEKEIKNVVTVMAKTCHYWTEHMSDERRQAVADALRAMDREQPLLRPGTADGSEGAAAGMEGATGLRARAQGAWVGVECSDVRAAIDVMRMLVASQVLSRREGTEVFVPGADEAVVGIFAGVYGFELGQKIVKHG
jgi:sirohydrochlorin cobaltochelatase